MAPFPWHWKPFDALTARELYAILALRGEVFVVEQRCAYLDPDGHDPAAWHLWTDDSAGRVLACARVFPPGVKYPEASIGRVVTAASVRGTGLGRALMAQALEKLFHACGDVPVHLSAQAHLERFYASFGFERVGEPYDEDGIPHVGMTRPPHGRS
jgi:ElaA protein